MLQTALKRIAASIPSLIGVVVVTFLLTRVLPGDTASYFAGPAATPEAIAEIRHKLGLDQSLPVQFWHYLSDLAHGHLGTSLTTGQPVVSEIAARLPASAELTLAGLILALVIALPLGIVAALRQGSWVDHLCRVVATAGVSLPVFFTGLLFVYAFYFLLGWAGPARPARCFRLGAADCDRLLPRRQPDRARLRDLPRGAGAARFARDHARGLLARANRAHHARFDAGRARF